MEKYKEYRESTLSGINKIPSHWQLLRIKWLLTERVQKSKDGKGEPLSMSQKLGIVPTSQMDVIPNIASSYVGAKLVLKGNLVFNKLKAHLGVFAISKYDGLVSPDYAVYIPTERTYLPYLEHLLRTQFYITEFQKKTTGVAVGLTRLYTDDLFSIHAIYPPLAEQEKIVSYLEDKTSKIDAYVADKEKEIVLLQELKQKTIADAVTKGLNPDAKMKDSGISWIGEIPEHWEVKRIASLFTGKVQANTDFKYHHAFKFYYGTLVPKNEVGDIEQYRETYVKYSVLRKDDIMINGLNLNYDFVSQRVAIAPSDGIITTAYVVARPRKGTNAQYYNYLFKTMDNMKLFHGMGTGIRLTLSFDELKKQVVVVPPQDEQQAIVTYIEEKCEKIDKLASELQSEIDYLKEYKQRLIADCVTGQIKCI